MYYIRDINKKFQTWKDLIEYCDNVGRNYYDNTIFEIPRLPNIINFNNNVNLYEKSKSIFDKLKSTGKNVGVLYSGGADSEFILQCMIANNFSPNMIVVYTCNPFEQTEAYNGFYDEHKPAFEKAIELQKTVDCFSNTEVVNIHITSEYLEKYYSNIDWPLSNYGVGMDVSQALSWSASTLPYIEKYCNKQNYVFLHGGVTPSVTIDKSDNINFYYVDRQFNGLLDDTLESEDFILYDSNFFNAYCSSIVKNFIKKKNIDEDTLKRYRDNNKDLSQIIKFSLPEFENISKNLPFQISKAQRVKKHLNNDLLDDIQNDVLKVRLLYLQACRQNPKWFQYYIKSFNKHREMFEKWYMTDGILSKFIPVKF